VRRTYDVKREIAEQDRDSPGTDRIPTASASEHRR
jgi:hypothetical protein